MYNIVSEGKKFTLPGWDLLFVLNETSLSKRKMLDFWMYRM